MTQLILQKNAKFLFNVIPRERGDAENNTLRLPHNRFSNAIKSLFTTTELVSIAQRSSYQSEQDATEADRARDRFIFNVKVHDDQLGVHRVDIRSVNGRWAMGGEFWEDLLWTNEIDSGWEISFYGYRERVEGSSWNSNPHLIILKKTRFTDDFHAALHRCSKCCRPNRY